MHFRLTATGKHWRTFLEDPEPSGETAREVYRENRIHWDRFLRDLLFAENLIVLSGSGTSLGPVVGGPSMGSLWDAACKQAGEQAFQQVAEKVGYPLDDERGDIEVLLSRCHLFQELRGADEIVDAFVRDTEALIVRECCFLERDGAATRLNSHTAFLRGAAQRLPRLPRLKLFTTNYDLCWETAASQARFVAIDGFSHTTPQEFDGVHFSYDIVHRDQEREAPDYIANVFHLYKLHGSVDWHRDGATGAIVRRAQADAPLLIYPRESKFKSSYDQPFFEMVSRFQMALRQPNVGLIVMGFGFNDHHLVQPIETALASNASFRMLVVDPSMKTDEVMGPVGAGNTKAERAGAVKPEKGTPLEQMVRRLSEWIDDGDTRIGLLSATFGEFATRLPDLAHSSETERHRNRVHGR